MEWPPSLPRVFWGGTAAYAALLAWTLASTPNSLHGVPDLVHTVKVENGYAAQRAAEALAEKGPDGWAALVGLLAYPDPRVKGYAATGVWRMRTPPPEAVPALIPLLDDKDLNTRLYARMILKRVGTPEAKAALEKSPER